MADSDEDNDKDFDGGMNMTGFLFGNIDENGQLENDILDDDAKQHLASLSIVGGRLGLSTLLQEMIGESKEKEEKSVENHDQETNGETLNNEDNDDVNYQDKSPTALDFSDINELADDLNADSGKMHSHFLSNFFLSFSVSCRSLRANQPPYPHFFRHPLHFKKMKCFISLSEEKKTCNFYFSSNFEIKTLLCKTLDFPV